MLSKALVATLEGKSQNEETERRQDEEDRPLHVAQTLSHLGSRIHERMIRYVQYSMFYGVPISDQMSSTIEFMCSFSERSHHGMHLYLFYFA